MTKIEEKIKRIEEKLNVGATSKEIEEYELLNESYKINGGYEYKKEYLTALKKFGFNESEYHKKIKNFSGGEKTKISFLKLLLSKPDLLLLDEPTNHLDIEAIEWLEEYLRKYPKSLVLVSHDRMFINKVTNKIYEIEYGKTEVYNGDYNYYEKEKKNRYNRALKDYEYQVQEIKRLQRIVERFRYKPSKASMAMAKLKQIERMTKLSKPEKENLQTFNFKFRDFKESGRTVLKVEELEIGYIDILRKVTFELIKKRRLGIIGENGSGKSTLLKTLVGKIEAKGGIYVFGHNVSIGYFDQELNTLNNNLTIYEEYRYKFPEFNDFEIRKNLAEFMFYADDLDKKIEVLSGGEKVRLQLCEIIFKKPNFLILDEPTNHLDILSKEQLESILNNYPGTILFVSHDRYFIKKIADSLLVFENNQVNYYDLNYEEYLERKRETKDLVLDKVILDKPQNKIKFNCRDLNKEIKKLEKQISQKESKIKELENDLFKPEIYSDYLKTNQIKEDLTKLENELLELLSKWEEYIS